MSISVVTHVTKPGCVAFTFDDGPYVFGPKLLEHFKKANGKITLFLNGANWSNIHDHAETVRKFYDAGHQIGSHTQNHPDLTRLSEEEIIQQMKGLEDSFGQILGKIPLYMRPPFGYYNEETLSILEKLGYSHVVMWNINTGDAIGYSMEEQKKSVDNADPLIGNIFLAHETHIETVDELVPYMINWAKKHNLKMVTVGELLDQHPSFWYKSAF